MANSRRADKMMEDFGVRLRASRIAQGFETAAAFAAVLGVEFPRYRKYERGAALPPLDLLEQICERTDRTADFLLFGAAPPQRPQ